MLDRARGSRVEKGMRYFVASLLFAAACTTAYADRAPIAASYGPRTALAIAPDRIRAPYDVQVLREDGSELPTYAYHGRFYVEGDAGSRYILRVTNPTPNRVEAVVSVDGLDVVDGESGDLRKRGYIVPAYGDVRIEGFRTTLDDVATFRFSSVDGSYAGMKGKARNVGVIAVAIFEERVPPEQQIVTRAPVPVYHWEDDVSDESVSRGAPAPTGGAPGASAPRTAGAAKAAAPPPGPPAIEHAEAAPREADADGADDVGGYDGGGEGGYVGGGEVAPAPAQPTYRPGLGTQFGESRYSSASYTRFVRATDRPIAIAELRYNDAAGLMALGIAIQPLPSEDEVITRETANPFPGDSHFARSPY
jgi:hypothetical protein